MKKLDKLSRDKRLLLIDLASQLNKQIKFENIHTYRQTTFKELYKHPSWRKLAIYNNINSVLSKYNYCNKSYSGNCNIFCVYFVLCDNELNLFARCKITPSYLIVDIL